MGEPLGVAEQGAAGDEHVGAGRGRAGHGVGADAAVDLDVDVVAAASTISRRTSAIFGSIVAM